MMLYLLEVDVNVFLLEVQLPLILLGVFVISSRKSSKQFQFNQSQQKESRWMNEWRANRHKMLVKNFTHVDAWRLWSIRNRFALKEGERERIEYSQ